MSHPLPGPGAPASVTPSHPSLPSLHPCYTTTFAHGGGPMMQPISYFYPSPEEKKEKFKLSAYDPLKTIWQIWSTKLIIALTNMRCSTY